MPTVSVSIPTWLYSHVDPETRMTAAIFSASLPGVRKVVSEAVLHENWNDISSALRARWWQLTSHDLRRFQGTAEQLVDMIQRRTGQRKNEIENELEDIIFQERSAKRVRRAIPDVDMFRAGDLENGTGLASDKLGEGYRHAAELVKRNPYAAVALLFLGGLVAGLGMAMLMRRQSSVPDRSS